MYKSIFTIVGLCFVSVNTARAHDLKASDAAQLTDGEIAYIYLQANQFDVEEAKLGIAHGTSPEVKQHGEMVAQDHSGLIAAFRGILMEHGITPTPPSDNAATEQHHQAVIDALKTRSGADFDREYITEAIIDHRAFIALVSETLLPDARNPALASHLKEVLPAFKKHLSMSIEAAKKLDVSDAR
jgi:predicted outer membrane protein